MTQFRLISTHKFLEILYAVSRIPVIIAAQWHYQTGTHSNEKIQDFLGAIQCKKYQAGRWWRMPLIPALRRQRRADLCEFEASLVYKS